MELFSLIILLFIFAIFLEKLKKSFPNKPKPKKHYQNETVNRKLKGDKYEKYIAKVYRHNGFRVWEHGLEKGYKDLGIDLVAYKNNSVILIQCKDWQEKGRWRISVKHIKKLESDANNFLDKNRDLNHKNIYLKYIISGNFINSNAIEYINSKSYLSYQVIKKT